MLRERASLKSVFSTLEDLRVRFARVRKCLPLPILDVEQPPFTSSRTETGGGAFAVVEDMRRFMNHEFVERIVPSEILWRDVAGSFFAHSDEAWPALLERLHSIQYQAEAMNFAEIDQLLDELSEGTEQVTPLPFDFSRADIYLDHP